MSELVDSLEGVSGRMKETATYFCQDACKFKLDDLLKELLNFIKELENAIKVTLHVHPSSHCPMSHDPHRRTTNV